MEILPSLAAMRIMLEKGLHGYLHAVEILGHNREVNWLERELWVRPDKE